MQHQDYVDRQIQLLAKALKELLSKVVKSGTPRKVEDELSTQLNDISNYLKDDSRLEPNTDDVNIILESLLEMMNHANHPLQEEISDALENVKDYILKNKIPIRFDLLNRI